MLPAQPEVSSATEQKKYHFLHFLRDVINCTPSKREAPLTLLARFLEVHLVGMSSTPKWLMRKMSELRASAAEIEEQRDRGHVNMARALVKFHEYRRTIAELRLELARLKGDKAEVKVQERLLRENEEVLSVATAANTECPELELFKED